MSNSDPNVTRVPLTLQGVPMDATVTIYDGRDRPVWSGGGGPRLTMSLPKGLYSVRVERLGRFVEQFVRLAEASEILPAVPERFTSAPLEGTATSHKYYSDNAVIHSQTETRAPIGDRQPTGGLFVFIRALDEQAARRVPDDLGGSLVLRDAEGDEATSFDEAVTKRNPEFGWVALSVRAEPGFYALHHTGAPAREAALHVFAGWQTQVFVLYHASPRLETMRVFLAPIGQGFDPMDDQANAVDLALDGFQNDIETLPDDELRRLLGGKFSNPMLGIVGAHILLQRLSRQAAMGRSPNTADRSLLEVVLGNLGYLLPGAADVAALQLLAARVLDRPPPSVPFMYPPMLRASLSAVVDASAQAPDLVPEEGLVDDIVTRVLADSPWSTWTPLGASWPALAPERQAAKRAAAPVSSPRRARRDRAALFDILGTVLSTGRGSEAEAEAEESVDTTGYDLEPVAVSGEPPAEAAADVFAEPDWVQLSLLDAAVRVEYAVRRGSRGAGMDVGGMARQLSVTPRVVRRAATTLLRHPEDTLTRFIQNAVPSQDPSEEGVRAVIGLLRKIEGPED